MELAIKILNILGTILGVLVAYKAIIGIVGFFKVKKYPTAKEHHKYAILIPARNEEKVIKNLLESIAQQDYPQDKLSIFVIADNCTDQTAEVAEQFALENNIENIKVVRHNNPDERTKGYALRYFFNELKKAEGINAYEGYFVFDADNVLMEDFISKMNDAFDTGEKIVVSFRNSKNMNRNWISFSTSLHWLRTCVTESRGSTICKLPCRVQGTGFLFASEVLKDGWTYTSLTEDRAFCTDAVVNGYKIVYTEDAVFLDEQPYKLKVAFRQRIRWSKGHLQSFGENCPKLLKNMFKGKSIFSSYNMFWINFPFTVFETIRKLIVFILQIIIAVLAGNIYGTLYGIIIGLLVGFGTSWLSSMALGVYVLFMYRKKIGKLPFFKTIFHIIMWPMFDLIGDITTWIALFSKVEWKPIPHDTVVEMSNLKK